MVDHLPASVGDEEAGPAEVTLAVLELANQAVVAAIGESFTPP